MGRRKAKPKVKSPSKDQLPASAPDPAFETPELRAHQSRVTGEMRLEQFAGPLPHPSLLAGYDKVVPGSAQQIVELFRKQSEHRMEIEKIVIKQGSRDSLLGIIAAFLLGSACIVGGVLLALSGHSIEGTVFGGSGMALLVSAFIYGTRSRQKERLIKAQHVARPGRVAP